MSRRDSLAEEKTRLIEFGRFAAANRAKRGLSKPETFNFLGFTHISGRSRSGSFQLKRKTRRNRMRARLRAIKEELRADGTSRSRNRDSGSHCATGFRARNREH